TNTNTNTNTNNKPNTNTNNKPNTKDNYFEFRGYEILVCNSEGVIVYRRGIYKIIYLIIVYMLNLMKYEKYFIGKNFFNSLFTVFGNIKMCCDVEDDVFWEDVFEGVKEWMEGIKERVG
ncbi:hypothetical protein CWI39_1748p0010, partial [Hamiltosporidium magnivora]